MHTDTARSIHQKKKKKIEQLRVLCIPSLQVESSEVQQLSFVTNVSSSRTESGLSWSYSLLFTFFELLHSPFSIT